jgi:hypothetical protein
MRAALSGVCLVLGAGISAATVGGVAGGSFEIDVALGVGAMLLMSGWLLRNP